MSSVHGISNLHVKDLGLIDYDRAFELQNRSVQLLLNGGEQSLLLCEHPPVLTLGRMAKIQHILASQEKLEQRGVVIRKIDRGGDITLHAPGQLVLYPILNLSEYGKDLHKYLRRLEQVAIDLCDDFGIVASRFPGQTGVWVADHKIASIGIGVRKWISYHGLSINVNTDMSLFSLIRPCGLDVQMSSISQINGIEISMIEVKAKAIDRFNRVFSSGD